MLMSVLMYLPLAVATTLAFAALYGALTATARDATRYGETLDYAEQPLPVRSPVIRPNPSQQAPI